MAFYWCLVYLFVSVTASVITQTSPPYSPVCPNDELVLTCVIHATDVYWQIDDDTAFTGLFNGTVQLLGSFSIYTLKNSTTAVITATNESIPLSANGARVGCSDSNFKPETYTINITGPPATPVSNISIIAITNDTLIMNWNIPSDPCIDHYNVTINSNNTLNESNITDTTDITISDLIIGTNYSFIIIPIDTIGREGPPSSLNIQYIWNVPAQVVNISWDQISNDSITIWWNSTQDSNMPSRPPTSYYIVNVTNTTDDQHTTNTNITITGLPLTDTNYTVSIIPVNVIGYGPSATVSIIPTMTSSVTNAPSSVTLTTHISTSTSVIYTPSSSNSPTKTSTTTVATASTAAGSNAVPVISGAIVAVLIIIIIIIIIVLIILVYAKRHRIKNKESHTANGNGNETKGVTVGSYRNNNIELQPTDPTYATPSTEYTPAAASTVRTLQGGDGPPSYPPPPPTTGQYSVLRGGDDDEVPPPVPAYNPNGIQEYSELRREGEKKNKQQQQHGAGPVYSTLNQDDTPPPVPPAYNPEGVQEYSVLKREGENKGQQGLSAGATGLYSTINKDTNNQVVVVDESAHRPVYADLAIAAKGKRPAAAPTQEQPVLYASVNNKSVPPPIPPPAAPDKVLYADLSIAAGKRTPKNKPPTEERVVYAAVNGNRKSTTQELIMDRLGGLDIPPPIPPKPKP